MLIIFLEVKEIYVFVYDVDGKIFETVLHFFLSKLVTEENQTRTSSCILINFFRL